MFLPTCHHEILGLSQQELGPLKCLMHGGFGLPINSDLVCTLVI